jgi:PEP-CTERM motif
VAETIVFTRVGSIPEPGTVGLLLGGIGATWFARRRKHVA